MSTSQAFDEIVDAELGLDAEGRALALKGRRDRRCRRLFDLSVDGGARAGAGRQLPAGALSYRALPRPRARRRHVESADRALSRRRTPDLDLRDGAAHRHGRRQAGHRPERDLRLRNLVDAKEFPYKVASGIVWDKSGFNECLDAACRAIDYDALRVKQKEARAAGRWFGIGIASYAELTGIGSRISVAPGMPINTGTETAIIRIDSTGAVTAAFGVASHGQGLETTLAQIVAEHLGARFEDIRIVQGDSAAVAGGTGTYASRSAVLAGGAATLAAQAVREKVFNARIAFT